MFFHYQEGSLVDHQAYKPYTLVGSPALRPPSCHIPRQPSMYALLSKALQLVDYNKPIFRADYIKTMLEKIWANYLTVNYYLIIVLFDISPFFII